MTLDDYGAFERSTGQKVFRVQGFWWRQVRPCFFRPLLPFRECSVDSLPLPASAWFGGVQHVVPAGEPANSTMSFLIFPDAGCYSLAALRHEGRRQVQSAAKKFTVRPLADPAEFKEHAHPVYTSFYARTHYSYLSIRILRRDFNKWADTVFQHTCSLVLGAYRGTELCAISIAHAIEDTLCYATFFAKSEALPDQVASLMLHSVRLAASQEGRIAQVYVGMPKRGAHGVDDFFLRRGCRVVTKPAILRLNPASRLLVRRFLPSQYERMQGELVTPEFVATETVKNTQESPCTASPQPKGGHPKCV